jgi:hypothetical protein
MPTGEDAAWAMTSSEHDAFAGKSTQVVQTIVNY